MIKVSISVKLVSNWYHVPSIIFKKVGIKSWYHTGVIYDTSDTEPIPLYYMDQGGIENDR